MAASSTAKFVMIDLEKSCAQAVNQAAKSPYHSEGESVAEDKDCDDCSVLIIDNDNQSSMQRSNYTNTSIVKLAVDTEETSSMASGHSSSQGFSYIIRGQQQRFND